MMFGLQGMNFANPEQTRIYTGTRFDIHAIGWKFTPLFTKSAMGHDHP